MQRVPGELFVGRIALRCLWQMKQSISVCRGRQKASLRRQAKFSPGTTNGGIGRLCANAIVGKSIAAPQQNPHKTIKYADVVELVDSLDLGSNAQACRFETCHPHHIECS